MARNLLSENQIKKLFKDHDTEKVERHNDGDGLIFEMRKKCLFVYARFMWGFYQRTSTWLNDILHTQGWVSLKDSVQGNVRTEA